MTRAVTKPSPFERLAEKILAFEANATHLHSLRALHRQLLVFFDEKSAEVERSHGRFEPAAPALEALKRLHERIADLEAEADSVVCNLTTLIDQIVALDAEIYPVGGKSQ